MASTTDRNGIDPFDGESLNGWSVEDVERLMRRTGRDRVLVVRFCRAVDKRLFLLLDDRQRRATLYFHLGLPDEISGD